MKQLYSVLILCGLCAHALAGDWPHWLGPTMNYRSDEKDVLDKFPDTGPKILWRIEVGTGFAGVSVAGNRCCTITAGGDITAKDNNDGVALPNRAWGKGGTVEMTIYCLDTETGNPIWKYSYEAPARFRINNWEGGAKVAEGPFNNFYGPKGPPTIDGERLYAYDHVGVVTCLQAADGKVLWQKNVREEHGGITPRFGYLAPPLVDGEQVIVPLFSEKECLISLDKKSGDVKWKGGVINPAEGFKRWDGYSIPIISTLAGRRQLLYFTGGGLQSLNPETGAVLAQFPLKTFTGEVVSPPLVQDQKVFTPTFYTIKSPCYDLSQSPPTTQPVWTTTEMKPRMANAVLVDGYVYGAHGSHDKAEFRCLNFATGEIAWGGVAFQKDPDARKEQVVTIGVGDKLILVTTYGDVVVAKTDPKQYVELTRGSIADGKTKTSWWTPPSFSNGRLFVRSTTGQIVCVDMRRQ